MGIPKFYRWLSERYPLLNQRIKGTEGPPEIDNLFLDMNGIIHNCTHANQTEVKLTEEEMMLRIFDYIDKLVQIIRPRKSLFMAIDGVAPRAKMNQQRSRRFKAAKERVEALEELRKKGEVVPDNPFDSNCITPGTPFMDRLGKHLRFFIRKKISEDPVWQAPCVIFSGHEVPGEGEHKIMEFLRWERRNPGYQPNQRHCLYGLDADLVMLSLVTHEPHFCLLREVVSYSGGNRGQPAREVLENPCADNFILFHISLLREYLDLEYSTVVLPWNDGGRPDVERIVDDFVLFCMLIGNDFLPALPTLDIGEGALNAIMTIYKELLPTLGGYLTWAGQLDRSRLEQVLSRLGHMEQEVLEERAKDAEFMEGKRAKRAGNGGNGRNAGSAPYTPPAIRSNNGHGPGGTRTAAGPGGASAGFGARRGRAQVVEDGVDVSAAEMAGLRLDSSVAAGALPGYFGLVPGAAPVLAVLAAALEEEEAVVPIVSAEPTMMSKEARQLMLSGQGQQGLEMWKARWYEEKLGAFNAEERRKVTEAYLAGVHWVLEYYYRGVASWDWYYPYYFAPMASELRQLEDITVTFRQGTPFRPYEQLLAVLPSASAVLLPPAFQHLMLDPHSPILDFYPQEFEVDMEGKRASWEGVVKVPFVDEARLLAAVYSVDENKLQADERARNMLGEILVFTYKAGSQETDFCQSTMPKAFRDVLAPESQMLRRPMPPPLPGTERGFKPELVSGTRTGLGVPYGLPTLRTISVVGSMRMAGVNVLGMPSKKESLLLALTNAGGNFVITADSVKDIMLGVRCFVNWPYLREARVMRVSDPTEQWYLTGHAEKQNKKWQSQEASKWRSDVNALVGALLVNHGIEVGKVDVVMHVRMCKGYLQLPDGSVQKQFFDEEVLFPLQCAVRRRPGEVEAAPAIGGSDLPPQEPLKEGDRVVYLGKGPHYGCVAIVLPDLGHGLTAAGKVVKPAGPAKSYRIAVQALGAAGDPMRTVARRVVTASEPRYLSSSDVARRVGCNGRVLGRITGNVWVSAGEERFDVGLSVRAARQMLCVPGYAAPSTEGSGWMYSQGLVTLLQEYQAKHNWLWKALAQQSMVEETGGNSLRAADMLPDLTPDERKAKVTAAVKWVKACPLSTKPLVKASVMLMTDEGVRMLQQATPMPVHCPPVEYERVPPALLMPPFQPGPDQVKLSVQGGVFALGDRVVCLLKAGIPAFGLHGTVIGVYDEALEVLFDKEFTGGSTLNGRVNSKCGAYVPNDVLLNTSIPTTLPLNKSSAPQQVQSGAHPVNTGTAQKDQSRPTSAVGQAGGARPSAAPKVLMGRAAVPSSGGRHGAEGAASQAVQSTQNHAALPSTTVVQKAAPAVHALPHATYLPTPFLSSPPPVVFDAVVAPAEAGPPPPPPSALLMAKARAAKARSAQPRPAPAQPMAAVAAAAVAAAIRQVLPAPAPVPPQRAAGMQDRPFDAGEGAALLGRLQAGAGLAAPNPAAPHPTLPTVGTILLNRLQQGARGAGVPLVEAPRTPPSAAPPAHAFPGPDQAGAVLLHQLRNGAADLQQVRPASQHSAQQPQPQMHHPGMPVQAPVGQVMGPGTMPMLYGGGPPVGMQASHPALVHAQIQIQQQIQQVQQVQQQLRQQAQHHQQQVQHHQQQYQQQQPQFFQHRTTHQYQQLQPSFQQLQPPFQQLQPPFQQLQPPYQQLQPPFQQLQPPYQQLQPPLQQLQPPYQQLQPPYQQLQPQTQDQQHLALPPTAASAATQNTALEPSQI